MPLRTIIINFGSFTSVQLTFVGTP